MSVKQLSTAIVAIAFGSCTFAAQANNGAGNNWMPPQQTNWRGFNVPSSYDSAPPAYNNNYQRPPPPTYRRPPAGDRVPNIDRTTPPPPTGPYRGTPAPQANPNRGVQRGAPAPRGRYNEPSAFNTPGYNPNRQKRGNRMPWGGNNNRFGSNKFWGRSGPSTWMRPGKDNWENSWDDMINTPSRMGDMPGGWSAPEVTVPNPVDMGDQMQDNMQDLPDQMRDGNIGNDVSN